MTAARPALRVLAASIAHNEASKIGRVLERFPPGLVDCDRRRRRRVDGRDAGGGGVEGRRGHLTHRLRSGAGRGDPDGHRARPWPRASTCSSSWPATTRTGRRRSSGCWRRSRTRGATSCRGRATCRAATSATCPLYRQLATRYVHPLLFSLIVWRRFTDTTNGFRAIRLSALDDRRIDLDQPWLDQYELEPYLFYKMVTPRLRGEGSAGDEDLPAARSSATPR